MASDINALLKQTEEWITPDLESVFSEKEREDITVQAAMYSFFAGGKRLRPMMSMLTFRMLKLDPELEPDVKFFASCLEMIHTYSLIHDDLPAMDNDDMRRGKPTCHKVYGEGIATLAGDLLLNTALERLLKKCEYRPQYIYAASQMAQNAGLKGMIGGQSIDIASTDKEISLDLLIELQKKKTGALIEAAVVTPYYIDVVHDESSGNKDEKAERLRELASHIGLAFQIKDDILDVTSNSEVLGKSTGKDERDSKATFVTLLGLEGAEERLKHEINLIREILTEFKKSGFDITDYETLTDFLENRDR